MSIADPIRYCLITTSLRRADGSNRGGWATYAEVMADALRCGGVLVTVLLVEEAGDRAVNDDVASGVVRLNLRWVVPLSRLLPGVVEGWQLLGAVRRLDRQHHFAVIEGPNVAGICWAVALWFPRRFLLRAHTSVVTVRGDAAVRSTFRQRFKQWLDRFATRSARMVVTHSKTHAATIADEYGLREASITIVPHAVPDPGAVSSGDPGRILAIANATRRKGVDVLLRAFAQVIGSAPDTELVLVGTSSGELAALLAAVSAPARCAQRIHALGSISDRALSLEWQRSAILVIPSRYESFGLVAVEGMARGKAVVATEGGALAEVIGDGGIVVGAENAEALAAALLAVLTSPSHRDAVGRAGRRRYERCYQPDELTRRMRELIAQF